MASNKKLVNYKYVDPRNYNLDIDHANIQGCLKILNSNFKISEFKNRTLDSFK